MKPCKKCSELIPYRLIIDGKERQLNGRSYCLKCSPFGSHNGYLMRKQATDVKYAITNNLRVSLCPICAKEFARPRNQTNKVCTNCRGWWRRYSNKLAVVTYLGGKCIRCNCSDIQVLEVHHTDPNIKTITFSQRWNLGIKTLLKEAKSCILLCANCHAKEHVCLRQDIVDYYGH